MKNKSILPLFIALLMMTTINVFASQPSPNDSFLIARTWHCFTSKANAPRFEKIIRDEVIPSLAGGIKGYKGIQVLEFEKGTEVEFTTIMFFDSIESVKAFAGENYTRAHIDPKLRPLFLRFDPVAQHNKVFYSSLNRQ